MAMAVELAARLNPPLCYAMLLLVVKTVGCLREESRGELGGSQILSDDVVVGGQFCKLDSTRDPASRLTAFSEHRHN